MFPWNFPHLVLFIKFIWRNIVFKKWDDNRRKRFQGSISRRPPILVDIHPWANTIRLILRGWIRINLKEEEKENVDPSLLFHVVAIILLIVIERFLRGFLIYFWKVEYTHTHIVRCGLLHHVRKKKYKLNLSHAGHIAHLIFQFRNLLNEFHHNFFKFNLAWFLIKISLLIK